MPDTELLVVTGLCTGGPAADGGVERVLQRLRAADPDVVVVHHDLRDVAAGRVRRRVRDRDRDTWTSLELAHGCVSCTLREDLLPILRQLAGWAHRIVLHLDPTLDPEQVCWALANVPVTGTRDPAGASGPVDAPAVTLTELVDLRGVVTAVDALDWLDDATGDEAVAERGLAAGPDDERTVAQLAVGQAEFADLLVHVGSATAWEHARVEAVLERLSPTALRSRVEDIDDDTILLRRAHPQARRGGPDDVHGPLLRGAPPLVPVCGVRLLIFSARRPFHPDRLHGAVGLLLDGVVRARGRIWLATRPDDVLWLESAGGGLQIGQVGGWLAGQGPEAWDEVSEERRALASLGWHPRFGDRASDLVVLTHAIDADGADAIDATLRSALLTDAELAAGEATWPAMSDPFGFWHTDPCGDPPSAVLDPGHARREER